VDPSETQVVDMGGLWKNIDSPIETNKPSETQRLQSVD